VTFLPVTGIELEPALADQLSPLGALGMRLELNLMPA
jgi:hypothetical protein